MFSNIQPLEGSIGCKINSLTGVVRGLISSLSSIHWHSSTYPSTMFCLCVFVYFFLPYILQSLLLSQINDFNQEEEAYGWSVSQYPQRKKIQDKLTPFLRLYETATDFLSQYDQWLHGPLSGVNPDKVPQRPQKFPCYKVVHLVWLGWYMNCHSHWQ